MGDRRPQHRRSLHLRHLLAHGLRRDHGRVVVELQISVPGALRSAAQMVSYEVSIGFVIITVLLCAAPQSLCDRRRAGRQMGDVQLVLVAAAPDVRGVLRLALAETNRPPFDLVEAESELVAGYAVEYSATPFLLFFLGEYIAISRCARWPPSCSWAAGCRRSGGAVHLGARRDLVCAQVRVHVLPVRHGEGDRSALPLRSTHAAGLEGVSAALARHGRDRRGRLAIRGWRRDDGTA